MSAKITRRTFTKTAAGAMAALTAASAARVFGANERVRLGFIGVGNRGDQLLDAFMVHDDCDVAAVCDLYEPYLLAARKKTGSKADAYADFQKMLDRKDLNAVVIASPDHWHALHFVAACKAGKDIYCEKPLSLTISEGRTMVEAAKKADRVTQVGLHRRSAPVIQEAVKFIRTGGIGKVTVAKAYHLRNETPMGIGNPGDGDPPKGLDWEMWLGPAPKAAFNRNRCLYKFRWFWDYSGGQLTNFGTHYLDVIQWALDQYAPRGVFCAGGKYAVRDNRQIPDTLEAVWEYEGALVTFSQFNANASPGNRSGWELEFRGTKGTLLMQEGNGYVVFGENERTKELPALSPLERKENAEQSRATKPAMDSLPGKNGKAETSWHARNFLDCVKSRKPTNCPVDIGHRSTTATLLARIALFRKQYIAWDSRDEKVTNDEAANKLLSYEYREPWKLT
jgi:predicted dehydrogenase